MGNPDIALLDLCHCSVWSHVPPALRDLLILLGRLGEFDGEQGLHAGMQIEWFTGPAGQNGTGVGMLETVHRC